MSFQIRQQSDEQFRPHRFECSAEANREPAELVRDAPEALGMLDYAQRVELETLRLTISKLYQTAHDCRQQARSTQSFRTRGGSLCRVEYSRFIPELILTRLRRCFYLITPFARSGW